MTDAEPKPWLRLRRKQLCGVQCYRQKPIGPYVVDFYAPGTKLVAEVDGSQHQKPQGVVKDGLRNSFLTGEGLRVLHFDNLHVLQKADVVMAVIYNAILQRSGMA